MKDRQYSYISVNWSDSLAAIDEQDAASSAVAAASEDVSETLLILPADVDVPDHLARLLFAVQQTAKEVVSGLHRDQAAGRRAEGEVDHD